MRAFASTLAINANCCKSKESFGKAANPFAFLCKEGLKYTSVDALSTGVLIASL